MDFIFPSEWIKIPLSLLSESKKKNKHANEVSVPSVLDNNLCYKVAIPIILDPHNMEGHLVICTQKALGILPLWTRAPHNTDAPR